MALTVILSAFFLAPGCHYIDDQRIPPWPVYLPFHTQADWTVYGVTGAMQWKRFIRQDRVPGNFPWTDMMNTGFGGVLLVSDIHGAPRAYDLACPVEVQRNVLVTVDADLQKARCPKCGSVYDIFTNYGYPVSGRAAELGYGLQIYTVSPGPSGQFMLISR